MDIKKPKPTKPFSENVLKQQLRKYRLLLTGWHTLSFKVSDNVMLPLYMNKCTSKHDDKVKD
jgi:hypothetical protein